MTSKEGKYASRFLDKYPTYLLITDLIEQVFPGAKHICVVRDPRSVLSSTLRVQINVFLKELGQENIFSGMVPQGYDGYLKRQFIDRHLWQILLR